MKISKYKDWEDKFFDGEELTPEEELFLKENIDHPYFSFLEEEKQDKMDLSFDDFLTKIEEPKVISMPKRKSFVNNYWMAASLIMIFGLIGFWTFKTPEIVEPSLISHKDANAVESIKIEESRLEEKVAGKRNQNLTIAKIEPPKVAENRIVKVTNNKKVEKVKTYQPEIIDRTMSTQDYNPNYVIVNGKPIYSEAEAIAVAENAINFFASNVSQTIDEAEPARNVSRDLHQVINF